MVTISKLIVTCDYLLPNGEECGDGAPHIATATVGDESFRIEFCPKHQLEVKKALIAMGFSVTASVDSKQRKGYVAKSGTVFTSAEARPWLVEQGLAQPKGRINTEQLQKYADSH